MAGVWRKVVRETVPLGNGQGFTFTFSHLADAFVQSDLQNIEKHIRKHKNLKNNNPNEGKRKSRQY